MSSHRLASLGKRQGVRDARGKLVSVGVKYAVAKKPKAILMEEVKGILKGEHKKLAKGITLTLQKNGYTVKWGVLCSQDFGGATDRERVFMVAVRKDCERHHFEFPNPTGPAVTLEHVLDPFNTMTDRLGRLPLSTNQNELARSACREAMDLGVNPLVTPISVDINCSKKYRSWGNNIAKTLTKARGASGGPWISTQGRCTTLGEMIKIQGFMPCEVPYIKAKVPKTKLGAMLGDAVPVNLLGHILLRLCWCAGLVANEVEFNNKTLDLQSMPLPALAVN